MRTSTLDSVREAVASSEAFEFSSIFTMKSDTALFARVMASAGPYLFTLGLLFALTQFVIDVIKFSRMSNNDKAKTENWASLLVATAKVTLIAVAVIGSLAAATLFAVLAPVLFIIALSLDTLRNGILAVFHWCQYRKAKKEALSKEGVSKHWHLFMGHVQGFAITLLFSIAITAVLLLPAIGGAAAAFAGIGVATVSGMQITLSGTVGAVVGVVILSKVVVAPLLRLGLSALRAAKNKLWPAKVIAKAPSSDNDSHDTTPRLSPIVDAPTRAVEEVASMRRASVSSAPMPARRRRGPQLFTFSSDYSNRVSDDEHQPASDSLPRSAASYEANSM